MMKSLALLLSVGSVVSFTCNAPVSHRTPTFSRSSRSSLSMGGASGYATSLDGKKEKVAAVKTLLSTSEMIFSVSASALSVTQVQGLRRSLPEGTTLSVVKNKLMNIASTDTDYENCASLLKGANMWFFIEEDIGGSIKAFNKFCKDEGKKESHEILGGVIDKQAVDQTEVKHIASLPSKIELIARIAGGIKAVPTKVAKVVKAPTSKLARAINLATQPEDGAE